MAQPLSFLSCYFNSSGNRRSDYVLSGRDETKNIDDTSGRDWQFRIAIVPEKENLNKAARALAPILKGHKFKIFSLNGRDTDQISDIKWDGTYTKEGNDREQRGKEVCVYMRFYGDSDQCEKTPDQWKQLMLQCWQALQQAGVDIGYTAPPAPLGPLAPFTPPALAAGEKPIFVAERLISPFSYTAFKPYEGERHGILHEGHYNPCEYVDPLAGVNISLKDLANYNIDIGTIYQQRIHYQTEHLLQAIQDISKSIRELRATIKEEEPTLDQIFDAILEDETNIEENRTTLEALCPRVAGTHLKHELIDNILTGKTKLSKVELVERIAAWRTWAALEKKDMLEDFNSTKLRKLLRTEQDQIKLMIEYRPYAMQIVYRRLVHLCREHESLIDIDYHTLEKIYKEKAAKEMDSIITCAVLFFLGFPLFILPVLGIAYSMARRNEKRQLEKITAARESADVMIREHEDIVFHNESEVGQPSEVSLSPSLIESNVTIFCDFLRESITTDIKKSALNRNKIIVTIEDNLKFEALELILEKQQHIEYTQTKNLSGNKGWTLAITFAKKTQPPIFINANELANAYIEELSPICAHDTYERISMREAAEDPHNDSNAGTRLSPSSPMR